MAPKVVSKTAAAGGGTVGEPKVFKDIPRRIAAYHLGRSLSDNQSFAQIQQIPFTFSIRGLFGKKIGLFGKKIGKKYKGPKWDLNILNDYFKFCLRERWPNCAPNEERTDPKKHLDHHNEVWKYEYEKHFPDLGMNQKEYLVFTLNRFNSVRAKLNDALYQSCRIPIDRSGRRQINIKRFLNRLKVHGLVPTIHVRQFTMENELKIQLLTEVRFYFNPETNCLINPPPPTKNKIDTGYCDVSKPVFVI